MVRTIPEPWYGDDSCIVYVGTSRDNAIRAAREQPENLRCYVDIQVWVNGEETMEYVNFK